MEVHVLCPKEDDFSILSKKSKFSILIGLILLFSYSQRSFSQEYVRGTIVNSIGKPIPSAIVKLQGNSHGKPLYCITNKAGEFSLPLTEKNSYPTIICISHIGYQNTKYHITDYSQKHIIVLKSEDIILPEVIVKNLPIKNIGDTLHFQVSHFKKPSDHSLEDVLKRLPGIIIESSGRILYKGESINKFYIEGLDLLSGQYAIATKNINADDISQISVYENHQPQRILKGIEFSDKAALNIKIKDSRKLKPFGTVRLGGGYGKAPLWTGENILMSVGRKKQLLSLVKGNAIGSLYENEFQTLTETRLATNNTEIDFSRQPFGTNKIPEEKYISNQSLAQSTNVLFKMSETVNLVINADCTSDLTEYNGNNVFTFFDGTISTVQIVNNHESNIHSKQAKLKFNIENNTEKLFLSENLNLSGNFSNNKYQIEEQSFMLGQSLSSDTYDVVNNLAVNKRYGNHIVSFTSDLAFLNSPINHIRILNYDSRDLKFQSIKSTSIQTRETISDSWLIGKYSNLGLKLTFDSYYLHLKNDLIVSGNTSQNVGYGYSYSMVISPTYQFHKNKLRWKMEFPIGFYALNFHQAPQNYTKAHIDFSTNLHYTITDRFNISLSYRRKHVMGDIVSLFKMPVYQTYRDLTYVGSDNLAENCTQSISPVLDYRNAVSGIFASVRSIWQIIDRNIIKNSQIRLNETTYETLNRNNKIYTFNYQLNVSKHFYSQDLLLSAIGNVVSAKRNIMRQEREFLLKTSNYNINLCIKKGWINESIITDFGFDLLYAKRDIEQSAHQVTQENKFISNITIIPYSLIELFISSICCNGSFQDSYYKYIFLNGGMRYKAKRVNFELLFRNITNQRSFEYFRIQGVDSYTASYQLRPFEIIASMKYSF